MIASFKQRNTCFSMLIYYAHFSLCNTGERHRTTTAKMPTSPSPPLKLLSVQCSAMWVGGKSPPVISPSRASRTGRHSHTAPPATSWGTGNCASAEASSEASSSQHAGCCSRGTAPKVTERHITTAWPGTATVERIKQGEKLGSDLWAQRGSPCHPLRPLTLGW